MDISEFGRSIKAKHPEYSDMSDLEVGTKMLAKFPQYQDMIDEVKKEIPENNWRDQKSNLNLKTEKLEANGQANFGSIPMPDMPDTPNVIIGMTTDKMGKIIDSVIVEIQDEKGNPFRVLKTNSLGQFRTSTPLANGRYLIISEKEGFVFDRVNIDLVGEIVKPIRIITSN